MTDLGVNFKDSCQRLWKILVSETPIFGGLNPAKCSTCRNFTCTLHCIEERRGFKATIDIGGKLTKIITANFSQESHSSIVAVPKTLKCYDCDKAFDREEVFCDCKDTYGQSYGMSYCHNRSVASHTGLEYQSQGLSEIGNQAFCLFCDKEKMNQLACERAIVASANQKMEDYKLQYANSDEDFRHHEAFLPLTSVYCK